MRTRFAAFAITLAALAIACSSDKASAPVDVTSAAPPNSGADSLGTVHPLALETYEGSGQTVHPDFLSLTGAGSMRDELLAITPYPFGNSAYENPVVYHSRDRTAWAVPVPSLNPVISPQHGYLSDPDLVFDPVAGDIMMYYRQVDQENEILLMRSRDGAQWSEPVRVVHAPNHEAISPSVVRRSANDWLMWTVNGKGGCAGNATFVQLRRSHDGVEWSEPVDIALDQTGYSPWHIEVQWVPSRSEYWALYNGKTIESCSTPALFFATSADGITWKTFPSPLLERGEILELYDIVYRSTFAFDASTGIVSYWFSGARFDAGQYHWSTVAQRRRLSDVFTRVSRTQPHPTRTLRAGVPLLMDPP